MHAVKPWLVRFALAIFLSSPALTWAQELAQVEDEKDEEKKPPRFHWDNGLWFQARHGKLRMKIGTQLQNDTAGFAGAGTQPVELEGGVEWRRARLYTLGWFGRRWRFKFQWDFVGGRGPSLTDAWLGIDFTLWRQRLHFRGGRFSSTFGLENDGSSNDILFMEQGLTSAFVPPQKTGVLIHSESNRRRWDLSFSSGASELECLICDVIGVAGRYSTSFTFGREDRRLHIGLNASRNWPDQAVNYAERPAQPDQVPALKVGFFSPKP